MYSNFSRHDSRTAMGQAPKYEPDETAALALLQYMDRTQLNEMLDNPSKIDDMIKDLQQVKVIQKDRETIIIQNKSLAEYNMGLQPRFESLKQEVATAYEEANTLKLALGKDLAKLGQSVDAVLAVLQTEAATADEESEQVAEDFCDDKIKVDNFLETYLPKRKDAFTKKAKAEKLAELIRQGGGTSNGSPYQQTMAPAGSVPYPTGHTPYPAGPAGPTGYGMPAPYPAYNR